KLARSKPGLLTQIDAVREITPEKRAIRKLAAARLTRRKRSRRGCGNAVPKFGSRSLCRDASRSSLLLHEKNDELGRLCTASIPGNGVHVLRRLIERLARPQRHLLPALYLHHHRPLKHIDKGVSIMPVLSRRPARRVLYSDHHALFAGYSR